MASSKHNTQVGLSPSVAAPLGAAPSGNPQLSTIQPIAKEIPITRKWRQEDLGAGKSTIKFKCPRVGNNELEVGVSGVTSKQTTHIQSTTNGEHMNNASPLLMNVTFDASIEENNDIRNAQILNYKLPPEVVNGAVICDVKEKYWRLGKAIGKGGCGEVFLASDNTITPVTSSTAKYVAKLEPHANRPLFVEMHCLINAAKHCGISENLMGSGIFPNIFGHGSHQFINTRYRFIILERYHHDLASLFQNARVAKKYILHIAINIVTALENLHKVGYCHNDVKAENIMIKKNKYAMKPIINPESEYKTFQPNSVRRSARIRDLLPKRVTRSSSQQQPVPHGVSAQSNGIKESLFLIDLGLATKFQNHGVHRPFIRHRRRTQAGTLKFCSRDAHLGNFWRRSDMECLGYNLLCWSEGYLPWSDAAAHRLGKKVFHSKELFMINVREMLKRIYGNQFPKYIAEFLHLVSQLGFQEQPEYERYRDIFKNEYRKLGYDCEDMQLNSIEIQQTCKSIRFEPSLLKRDILMLKSSVLHNSVPVKSVLRRVFLQDPSQIARERATKESEHDEASSSTKSKNTRHYEGNPTYAILNLLQRLRSKGIHANNDDDGEGEGDGNENNGLDEKQQGAQANDNCEGNDQSVKGVVSMPPRK